MSLPLYIRSEWIPGEGEPIRLINPCTGGSTGSFAAATTGQVDVALAQARAAFPAWSATPFAERAAILRRYASLIGDHQEEIARTISQDTGKPLWESLTEVSAMQGKVEISIEAHESRCAEFGKAPSITRFRPHGVVVVLGPFNLPGHLPNGHLVPALLAGNTVIFKPSDLTPRTGGRITELLLEAGLPAGAIQLVHGGGALGAHLCAHDEPDAILFTGSSATGKRIAAANSHRPGRMLALEMGGNNPLVVAGIDDPDAACLSVIQSAFLTTGQRCTCARRLIVVDSSQSPAWIQHLVSATRAIRIGGPADDPPPFMGPVIRPQVAARIFEIQSELVARGATPLLESQILHAGTGFISPGILDVTEVPDREDEEVFGPLLQLIRVPDLDAAIAEANRTRFGLAAGLFSPDPAAYETFRREIRAGIVNWNQPLTGASSAAPFGGIGDSGNHRPGAYFAADYCSHPVASLERAGLTLPESLPPGIQLPQPS